MWNKTRSWQRFYRNRLAVLGGDCPGGDRLVGFWPTADLPDPHRWH